MHANRWLLVSMVGLIIVSSGRAAELRGIIQKVDPTRKVLVVDERLILRSRGQSTFALDATTRVQIGLVAGQAGSLADLKEGQRVRVQYETRNGVRHAQLVRVTSLLARVLPDPAKPDTPPQAKPPTKRIPPPQPGADPQNTQSITGLLRRIAYTDREIIIAQSGPAGTENYTTLSVVETTRFLRDGQPISMGDLLDEEVVTVHYAGQIGQPVALVIQAGQATELPAPTPLARPDQPPGPAQADRMAQLRQLLMAGKEFAKQAAAGKSLIPIDPELAANLHNYLVLAELGLPFFEKEVDTFYRLPDNIARARYLNHLAINLTGKAASGQLPCGVDPQVAAGFHQALLITDQVLAFIESEQLYYRYQ